MLVPAQRTTFIGVALDSTLMTARLSEDRVALFRSAMDSFHLGETVKYRDCMSLAGSMASALSLVRLGRLHMRPFQKWVLSLGIPSSQGQQRVTVTDACMTALLPWRDERLLTQ